MQATERKKSGAHYTPPPLADFVAREIAIAAKDVGLEGPLRILDPACGDGELLVSALHALRGYRDGLESVLGYDTDGPAVGRAADRITKVRPDLDISIKQADFLERVVASGALSEAPDLFQDLTPVCADVVITNPPYVRTQVLGADRAQRLAEAFDLSGRVDIYHAFVRALATVVRPHGLIGMIVSNRFMTTKAGAATRENLLQYFDLLHVWDFGDTRLFDAAVLPAVILGRRKGIARPEVVRAPAFISTYLSGDAKGSPSPEAVLNSVRSDKGRKTPPDTLEIQEGTLDHGRSAGSVWRLTTPSDDRWLSRVGSRTWKTFGDIAPIRVGVKTTADAVFIRRDWDDMPAEHRPELLRPLITHHEARPFRPIETQAQPMILYTHVVDKGKRRAVELDEFPRARRYLEMHRARLEGREYVRKAGRKWYEVWVPQDPDSWTHPKIVFRDIAERPTFWLDLGGRVVNGDCYWMDMRGVPLEVRRLILGIGNSKTALRYYDLRFGNRLYAGRRRFMTQYVAEFPIPDPSTMESRSLIEKVAEVERLVESGLDCSEVESQFTEVDVGVAEAFGLDPEEVSR